MSCAAVTAAGRDAVKRPEKRFFSRHEARRRIQEAERAALGLLEAAKRGLPPQNPNPDEGEKPASTT